MRATKSKLMTLWVVGLLMMPFVLIPNASAWTAGDEAAIFGHTFVEEYWTNDSIFVEGTDANASLTASYVHVDEFSAFLLAFNNANRTDGTQLIMPYQLFGMHFKTPENREVFIGAIFAFLLVHDEQFNNNDLPDVGNEPAWYVVPLASDNTWPDSRPSVEPIVTTKLGESHYRFGMSYYNLTCRVVSATGGFWASLIFPLLTVLISELTVEYDIVIDETGAVHAETLYTIGQVTKAKDLFIERDPSELINETMGISAVHFLSIFTSQYTVSSSTTGNTIQAPTATSPLDYNLTIGVGPGNERAFDIGMGREYALINETTDPWTTVSEDETALNALLGVRLSDLILIAWQAPMSAWLFAHMAYGLSEQMRNTYADVPAMVSNVNTAFTNTNWWYAVTFPEWNGLRVQQDPVYTAYTNLYVEPDSGGGVLVVILVVGVIAVIWLVRRRR